MAGAVRVRGLRETIRAFQKLQVSVAKEIREELMTLAEPVARTSRGKISKYQGASLGTIRPRASVQGAFVTQGARKRGYVRRPDFGHLQQGLLEEALDEHQTGIFSGVENSLDRLTRSVGF